MFLTLVLVLLGTAGAAPTDGARASKRFEKRSAQALPYIEDWADGSGPEVPLTKEDEDVLSLTMRVTFALWDRDQATADVSDLLATVPVPEGLTRAPYVAWAAYGDDGGTDQCCYEVHFPLWVDGEPMQWLVAHAGWATTAASCAPTSAKAALRPLLPSTLPSPGPSVRRRWRSMPRRA